MLMKTSFTVDHERSQRRGKSGGCRRRTVQVLPGQDGRNKYGMLSEDFQDKVLDFEFKSMGMDKKLPRNKVFDFSIMKSLATK